MGDTIRSVVAVEATEQNRIKLSGKLFSGLHGRRLSGCHGGCRVPHGPRSPRGVRRKSGSGRGRRLHDGRLDRVVLRGLEHPLHLPRFARLGAAARRVHRRTGAPRQLVLGGRYARRSGGRRREDTRLRHVRRLFDLLLLQEPLFEEGGLDLHASGVGCPTSPANASRAASWATTSCASRISRARSVTRTRPAPTPWRIDQHYPMEKNSQQYPGAEWLSEGVLTPIDFYALPYRCFYSKDVRNMFMAGRNISVTHIALGSTRVMRTCGMIGEVVGMAASGLHEAQCAPTRHLYDLFRRLCRNSCARGRDAPTFPTPSSITRWTVRAIRPKTGSGLPACGMIPHAGGSHPSARRLAAHPEPTY